MSTLKGFGSLVAIPEEKITDKITRRVLAGEKGMMVWWKIKAGAHAAAHSHPHEQIVWMLSGKMEFRIGGEPRNPLAVDLPTALPVVADDRPAFMSAIAPLVAELQVAHAAPGSRIAASD